LLAHKLGKKAHGSRPSQTYNIARFFYVNGKRFLQLMHESSTQGHAFKYKEKTFKSFTPSLERMSITIT